METRTHSTGNHYLCTLIPSNLLPEQVEQAADSQALPTIVVTAPNANAARGRAHRATGLAVHDVCRIPASDAAKTEAV